MLSELVWIPTLLLLGYAIPACYYDIKYREVPQYFWVLLITICLPITGLLYYIGVYPVSMFYMSLGACGIYLLLRIGNVFQGADLVYLMCISLFLVQNPYTGHILMPISFGIFLIAAVIVFAIIYQVFMAFIQPSPEELHPFVLHNLPGFPMMLPISLALVLTVVLA